MLDNLTDDQIDEAARYAAMQTVAADEPCPECDGSGTCPNCRGEDSAEDCEDCRWTGECPECDGTGRFGLDPASDLTRAWEAAGGEGQVVS